MRNPNPKPDIRVYIGNAGDYRVWPPAHITDPKADVVVRNLTDEEIELKFDWGGTLRIQRGRDGKFAAPQARDAYGYSVTVAKVFRAAGHSDPSIIVD